MRPCILAQRRQTISSKFSRAAEENKISNTSHSMCSVETSQLFREGKLFLWTVIYTYLRIFLERILYDKKRSTTYLELSTMLNVMELLLICFSMWFDIFMPKLKITCSEISIYVVSVCNIFPYLASQKDVLERRAQNKMHSKSGKKGKLV